MRVQKVRRVQIVLIMLVGLIVTACGQESPTQDKSKMPEAQQKPAAADPEHGKQLADACMKCHPASGKIVKREYPQINGLDANYLGSALLAYLSGKREHDDMRQAVQNLNDGDLKDLAAYYSSLDTPWKNVLLPVKPRQTAPDPKAIAAGQKLAQPCLSCHGENGNSNTQGVPSLAGLSQQYIATALQGYFQGSRKNEVMQVFKHAFDKDKIAKLGAYFASQPRQPASLPVKGSPGKGEKLATQHCIGCHGEHGNSFIDRFPTLAGQNAMYLYQATLGYRNGERNNPLMKKAITGLSKQDVINLAAYYATQKPATPQKPEARDSSDPMQVAEAAAASCFGCHGKDGNSNIKGTPSLSGLKPAYVGDAIKQYQNGDRKHELMKSFVDSLQNVDIDLIAAYFAVQEPKTTANSGKGNPEKAKEIAAGCEGCHGAKGISTSKPPSIAGQDADYLMQALLDYQNNNRSNADMQNAVNELSKSDFNNLATYFAQQQPAKPDVQPLQTAEQLSEKCNRCHYVQNPTIEQSAPRIAGQSEAYLLKALYEYKTQTREQSTMFAMLDVLNDWEIRDLARYYARLNSTGK